MLHDSQLHAEAKTESYSKAQRLSENISKGAFINCCVYLVSLEHNNLSLEMTRYCQYIPECKDHSPSVWCYDETDLFVV